MIDAVQRDPSAGYGPAFDAPPADDATIAVITEQLGRPARGRPAVMHRCGHGLPTVVRVDPRLELRDPCRVHRGALKPGGLLLVRAIRRGRGRHVRRDVEEPALDPLQAGREIVYAPCHEVLLRKPDRRVELVDVA